MDLDSGRWTITSRIAEQSCSTSDLGTNYELTNGLTGVRIAKPAGNPAPFNKAPIQGIRLADHSWSATGPNYLAHPAF